MEAQRRSKDKGEPEEAAAEIEAGGRRKEIADETIRETACVEVARPKPPLNEEWRKSKAVSTEKSGLFCFYILKCVFTRYGNLSENCACFEVCYNNFNR